MTNERIQQWLATAAARPSTAMELLVEADQIIRFLAGPEGALQIADRAACEALMAKCVVRFVDDKAWSELEPVQNALQLDPEDVADQEHVLESVRYLIARGLLQQHPKSPLLVRALNAPV